MVPLGDEAQVKARLSPFGDMWNLTYLHLETVLVSVQDRCTVWAKCAISLEIVLDAPEGNPW